MQFDKDVFFSFFAVKKNILTLRKKEMSIRRWKRAPPQFKYILIIKRRLSFRPLHPRDRHRLVRGCGNASPWRASHPPVRIELEKPGLLVVPRFLFAFEGYLTFGGATKRELLVFTSGAIASEEGLEMVAKGADGRGVFRVPCSVYNSVGFCHVALPSRGRGS